MGRISQFAVVFLLVTGVQAANAGILGAAAKAEMDAMAELQQTGPQI